MSRILKTATSLILLFSFCSGAIAQDDTDQFVQESKNDLMIVISGGVAGAILGLSTLSFVDEPKNHTRNILVGASIGIIAGVAFVAFTQANKSRELLYSPRSSLKSSPGFGTLDRSSWHWERFQADASPVSAPVQLGYSFSY